MIDLTQKQIEDALTDKEIKLLDNANYAKIWPVCKSLAEARIENKRLRDVIGKSRKYIQHTPECEKGKLSDHCTCGVMQFIPEMYPSPLKSEEGGNRE